MRRESIIAWFQYAGLWALAIAWPVYQNIASGPEALTGVGARRLDLLLVVILVSLVAPTVLILVELLVRRLGSKRLAEIFRAIVIGALVGVLIWQQLADDSALPRYFVPLLALVVTVFAYLRSQLVCNFTELLGLAMPVVIVAFCLRYPIQSEVFPHEPASEFASIETDTPVVLVIFDELPLVALESGPEEIDGSLFPGFSELASKSTWYPDAVSVADQTLYAVPAIMTGQTPDLKSFTEPKPPGLADFPDNLCTAAEAGGYAIHAYEPITDLCDRHFGAGSRVTALLRRGAGATEDTQDVAIAPAGTAAAFAEAISAPFNQPWGEYDADREKAVDWFVEDLPDDPRSLSVLHIALPHIEWQYLPDGKRYAANRFTGAESLTSPLTRGEVDRDMQQMMLQLSFTDRELARIVARMKALGIWDESLFVVTADHGGAFLPGGSRRIAGRNNSGWIMPVPLFVKYPNQENGQIVEGDASSLDIAATVLDVLGTPGETGQGTSLSGRSRLGTADRLTYQSALGDFEVPGSEVREKADLARRHRNRVFGGGNLYSVGGHQNLIGKDPALRPFLRPVEFTDESPASFEDVVAGAPEVPSYFQANLGGPGGPRAKAVAVALNGTVVATAPTWTDAASAQLKTGVNLPPEALIPGANIIKLYEIR